MGNSHHNKKVMTDMNGNMEVDGPAATVEQLKEAVNGHGEIDEGLYSRQLYVLGHEAMKRMGSSNVLIVGLRGLGVEIAKNIALAGVKSLTLFDPKPAALQDLSSQFFLHPEDVGKPRADVTAPRVSELNPYTPVGVHPSKDLTTDLSQLKAYQVVVLTDTPLKDQIKISDYCHQNGIYVVITDTFGLFGNIFTDFGKNFTVVDPTGENPLNGIVAGVDESGLVSALDETRHGLEDGDYVTFTEVEGMEGLNDGTPRKITVKGPYTFSIGDVSGLGQYKRGGLYTQVKMPKIMDFEPLQPAAEEAGAVDLRLRQVRSASTAACWLPGAACVCREERRRVPETTQRRGCGGGHETRARNSETGRGG